MFDTKVEEKGEGRLSTRLADVHAPLNTVIAIHFSFSIMHSSSMSNTHHRSTPNNRQYLNQVLQKCQIFSPWKGTLSYGENIVPERPEHAQLWRGWYKIGGPQAIEVIGDPATSKLAAREDAAGKMARQIVDGRNVSG